MFCHLREIGVQREEKKTILMCMRKHQAKKKRVLPNMVDTSAIIIQLVESDWGQKQITSINENSKTGQKCKFDREKKGKNG